MKVCIYGAGAIGGFPRAELALAGTDAHPDRPRPPPSWPCATTGSPSSRAAKPASARIACTDSPAEAGPQDYVVVTLKALRDPAA
jgi:2-dehydropantoate 2-reductase